MNTSFIEETIRMMLELLGARDISISKQELDGGDIVKFSVETPDAPALIGADGKNLMALNYLVKKVAEHRSAANEEVPVTSVEAPGKHLSFIVDINNYQEKKIQDLKGKARIMAERARYFKSDVELSPMNPYERMIIHSFFSSTPDIHTESIGHGKDRHVVLKYTSVE